MATRSSVLAWRIPGTAEPGGLPSMESHRFRHDWSDLAAAASLKIQGGCNGDLPSICGENMETSPAQCRRLWPFPEAAISVSIWQAKAFSSQHDSLITGPSSVPWREGAEAGQRLQGWWASPLTLALVGLPLHPRGFASGRAPWVLCHNVLC